MKSFFALFTALVFLSGCTAPAAQTSPATAATATVLLPNPASVYCEKQGHRLEIRTAADGSQNGVCIFADGSECDEWAYYRGECGPAGEATTAPEPLAAAATSTPAAATAIPTARPVDPADYQGWWTYTHAVYGFTLLLPEDWIVEEVVTADPLMNGHMLMLKPEKEVEQMSIRLTFRRTGEESRLWPTGVGQGEFIPQGTLEIGGQPAQRVLLVCPTGEITSIWYHQADGEPNVKRGDLEFGIIFSAGEHCTPGQSLGGKVQYLGEMIIASVKAP